MNENFEPQSFYPQMALGHGWVNILKAVSDFSMFILWWLHPMLEFNIVVLMLVIIRPARDDISGSKWFMVAGCSYLRCFAVQNCV